MKKLFVFAIAAAFFASCDKDEAVNDSSFAIKSTGADYTAACSLPRTTVTGNITTNTTWDNDHVWVISGVARVTNNATLTIEPGTFIIAAAGVQAPTGVLVITKTGKINAVGTATSPILFTSYNLLDCNSATPAAPGDFGGVVFLGDAPVNTGSVTNVIEGLGDVVPATDFQYGGTNSSHDVGSFQYVRIEFAGRRQEADVEINGLTFGGVGNAGTAVAATKIHHIQVSYGLDDAFEFFGGTVNATDLIAFAQDDDGLDFDFGYTGSITRALVLADFNSTHSGTIASPDSNGIELDNGPTNSSVGTPFTRPVLNQLSVIGVSDSIVARRYENGIHVRRNGQINLSAATVTGYTTGIRWEAPSVATGSTWTNFRTHGFANPTAPTTTLGFGNQTSSTNPATPWSLTQPFFNNGALNFAGGTGAFVSGDWASPSAATWVKYSGF